MSPSYNGNSSALPPPWEMTASNADVASLMVSRMSTRFHRVTSLMIIDTLCSPLLGSPGFRGFTTFYEAAKAWQK